MVSCRYGTHKSHTTGARLPQAVPAGDVTGKGLVDLQAGRTARSAGALVMFLKALLATLCVELLYKAAIRGHVRNVLGVSDPHYRKAVM